MSVSGSVTHTIFMQVEEASMALTRGELRDELEVLLGAARTLSPDTDTYLAETFLSRIEMRTVLPKRRWSRPLQMIRRRVLAMMLVVALIAVGGPVAIHEYLGSSIGTCTATVVNYYPSMSAAKADHARMRANGYARTGSHQFGDGRVAVDYGRLGGCAH